MGSRPTAQDVRVLQNSRQRKHLRQRANGLAEALTSFVRTSQAMAGNVEQMLTFRRERVPGMGPELNNTIDEYEAQLLRHFESLTGVDLKSAIFSEQEKISGG